MSDEIEIRFDGPLNDMYCARFGVVTVFRDTALAAICALLEYLAT